MENEQGQGMKLPQAGISNEEANRNTCDARIDPRSRSGNPNRELMRGAAEALEKGDQCSSEYGIAAFALYHAMTGSHREALSQLIKEGPVYDGNVISKTHRDDLMSIGLASRVVYKGEQGYTAANYIGWDVMRAGQK